mmetsp:Transcript_15723/g.26505  ORF Transcript_15723/g.26505 Transcript_15723/m.26505 type:complete len:420 (-) Transcript_15723:68-1327(-)
MEDSSLLDFMTFRDCEAITIQGKGAVEGQGYDWWVREWKKKNAHGRPHLLRYERVQTSEISGVAWRNSPRYHMKLDDVDSIYVHDMEIYVDILKQLDLVDRSKKSDSFLFNVLNFFVPEEHRFLKSLVHNYLGTVTEPSLPTMPLNTDGIDPSGSNVTIRNVNITNWDDAVAVKPSRNNFKVAKDGCSQDILVENANVKFGVGMTIGSVPPNSKYNCIRRVQFKKVNFEYPMKAIYVKTNPGNSGNGEIMDILYEDIKIHFPVWWNIYIGPQQQKQPDGGGPGCMLYPLGGCETQPRINVGNITLRNVESHGGFLPPGLIRCNATNPCHNINLDNVNIKGWWEGMKWSFISEYAYGSVNNTYPDPRLGQQSERVFQLATPEHLLDFVEESVGFYGKNENDITAWEVLLGIVVWAATQAI